jgi:hypothetical protein
VESRHEMHDISAQLVNASMFCFLLILLLLFCLVLL